MEYFRFPAGLLNLFTSPCPALLPFGQLFPTDTYRSDSFADAINVVYQISQHLQAEIRMEGI